MAENTIDTLALEISSNAASASKGLDRLTASLMGLDKATGRLQTGKFSKIGTELQAFSKATAKLKGLNVPDFSGLASSIGALGKINFNDSGITKTINALKRLGETDLSGFDTNSFSKIAQSIQGLSNIPDVSNNLNRFISSISKLANAGDKSGIVATELPRLGDALKDTINKIAAAANISDPVNLFVQSIGRLATAGNKTGQTAAQLNALADAVLHFFDRMKSAPDISEKTIRMTEALAQLASVGGKVGTATGSASKAFTALGTSSKKSADMIIKAMDKAVSSITKAIKKIASLLGKGALTIAKGAKSIVSSFTLIGKSNKGLNSATTSLKNLFRAALPILGIRQLFNWGRDAVETASSLTEVQNIVDVTFGDMKSKVEELAETSIGDFGMSELTLKQISSRFQAMGMAMGFTQDKMSDMSIELTKLAADMASFYNVEQADVAEDLAAIFTGQTRPLRQYGLDLTQATLEEWALKNGMDANIQSMSQAEKTLLRYQYVLANTTAAQGDFARTAGTWANQTRILAQSFEALGSIIGGVIINAFKPFVSTLNKVMQKVISFAKTVADALGTIFGWTFEVSGGGVLDDTDEIESDLSGAEDASGGVADGLGDAADNADKLKKKLSILPFDKLNQLASDLDMAGTNAGGGKGGSGSGAGGAGGVDAGGLSTAIVPKDGVLKKYESEIKSLEQLGEHINQALVKAMQHINWEGIYEKARGFGSGLASFLNGLISPELFSETAELVANSLNTALYALNSFGTDFNWTNFGNSISSGINSFFRNFKADLAADTFDTFANGILDAMVAIFGEDGIEWSRIGAKISVSVRKALNGIKWEKAYEAAGGFGKGLAKFMNKLITPDTFAAIGTTLGNTVGSVVRGVHEWVTEADFYTWGVSLGTALNNFFNSINWEEVGLTLDGFFKGIVDFITGLVDTAQWEDIGYDIGNALSKVHWSTHLYNAGKALMKAFGGLLNGFSDTPAGEILLGIAAALLTVKTGAAALRLSLETLMKSVVTGGISSGMALAASPLAVIIQGGLLVAVGQVAANEITGGPKTAFQGLAEIVGGWFERLAESKTVQKSAESLRTFIKNLFSFTGKDITDNQNDNQPEIEVSVEAKDNTQEGLSSAEQNINNFGNQFKTPEGGIITTPEIEVKDNTEPGLSSAKKNIQGLSNYFKTPENGIDLSPEIEIEDETETGLSSAKNNVEKFVVSSLPTYTKKAKVEGTSAGENYPLGFAEGIEKQTPEIEKQLNALTSKLIEQPKLDLDMHSPSGVTKGYGENYDLGFAEGIRDFVSKVTTEVTALLDAVKKLFPQEDSNFKAFGTKFMTEFKSGISEQENNVISAQRTLISNLKAIFGGYNNDFNNYGSDYMDEFESGISKQETSVKSAQETLIENLLGIFSRYNSDFYNKGYDFVGELKNGMNAQKKSLSDAVGKIATTIKNNLNIGSDLYSKGQSIIRSFVNGMKSVYIPTPHLTFTTSTMQSGNSVTTSTSSSVSWYGNGGFFKNPAIIGVGEAGREIALPLDNKRVMRTVSNSIMENASHQFVDTSAIESAVERAVSRAMMRNSGNQPINVYATLKTENDEVLARAVTRGQKKLDYRMNPTPQF